MKKWISLFVLCSFFLTGFLKADIKYWEATLPGGTYLVAVSMITSVSIHDYFVEGVGQVSEVTIDSTGNSIARFYAIINPVSGPTAVVGESAKQAYDRLKKSAEGVSGVKTADPMTSVVKTYPTTTHAHTVEYRLADKDELDALFKSARSSLISGTAGTYKIKE